jgi:hypothetical protein
MNVNETDELPAVRILKKAMAEGKIVNMDPRQIIITIIGSCLFYFIGEPIICTVLIREANFDREKFIEERKEAIFKIIYFGLIPRRDH